jgi:hypothetical protein
VICVWIAGAFLYLGIFALSTREPSGGLSGRLTIDATRKSFGDLPLGVSNAMMFNLTNHTSGQMKILGATSSCYPIACLNAEGLPLVIPPWCNRQMRVMVRTRDREGRFLGSVTIFTDCPENPKMDIEVSGDVKREPS